MRAPTELRDCAPSPPKFLCTSTPAVTTPRVEVGTCRLLSVCTKLSTKPTTPQEFISAPRLGDPSPTQIEALTPLLVVRIIFTLVSYPWVGTICEIKRIVRIWLLGDVEEVDVEASLTEDDRPRPLQRMTQERIGRSHAPLVREVSPFLVHPMMLGRLQQCEQSLVLRARVGQNAMA